jgi:hypothetical protein
LWLHYYPLVVAPPHPPPPPPPPPTLPNPLHQLFELLLCVVERPRYRPLFEPALAQLAGVALPYMLPTPGQVSSWADNPDTYVAEDELEGASPRWVSGRNLWGSLCHLLCHQLVTFKDGPTASIGTQHSAHI